MTQKEKIAALEKRVQELEQQLKITNEFYELWKKIAEQGQPNMIGVPYPVSPTPLPYTPITPYTPYCQPRWLNTCDSSIESGYQVLSVNQNN